MGPHAGVAGSKWPKADLSLFPNNNISPRHQNPRTISLGFQIIICPLSLPRPITICTQPDNCTVCKSILTIGMTHPHFSMGHPLDAGHGNGYVKFGLFSLISDTQQTSHIRFHSLRTWLFILCRRSYFPNPTLFQRWKSSKLFQVGKYLWWTRWTRCRRARL